MGELGSCKAPIRQTRPFVQVASYSKGGLSLSGLLNAVASFKAMNRPDASAFPCALSYEHGSVTL